MFVGLFSDLYAPIQITNHKCLQIKWRRKGRHTSGLRKFDINTGIQRFLGLKCFLYTNFAKLSKTYWFRTNKVPEKHFYKLKGNGVIPNTSSKGPLVSTMLPLRKSLDLSNHAQTRQSSDLGISPEGDWPIPATPTTSSYFHYWRDTVYLVTFRIPSVFYWEKTRGIKHGNG